MFMYKNYEFTTKCNGAVQLNVNSNSTTINLNYFSQKIKISYI